MMPGQAATSGYVIGGDCHRLSSYNRGHDGSRIDSIDAEPSDMMTGDLTDEYVASVLADDAKKASLGLEGLLPAKPANKPRPNTRFLRNIIKDTDSHNAALLAKETAESSARLQKLSSDEYRQSKLSRMGGAEMRKRQLGLIAAHLSGSSTRGERRDDERRDDERRDDERKRRRNDGRHVRDARRDDDERKRRRNDGRHGRDEDRRHRRPRSRSRSPEQIQRGYRSRSRRSRSREGRRDRRRRSRESRHEDSDPLEDIVGPLPAMPTPTTSRGRGTVSAQSGIEDRFAASYDPRLDVRPDDDSDWDQALEALRDRVRWQQQGAERLRTAGFSEDDIAKWEGGTEKSVHDVRWAKRGESREWDRGKVVDDDDGIIMPRPQWGRLKDT